MKKLLLAVALLVVSSVTFAQLTQGKFAITTSIGPGGSIGGAYALSDNMRLNAGLNFNSTSVTVAATALTPSASASQTNFGIGASLWMYKPAMESVTMFYGGGVNFGSAGAVGNTPSSSTLGITVTAGAEYWFNSHFAWGGNINVGYTSSGPSGATTSVFGTQGVATSLTWWF